ncbi:unnamed protein product [Clonostachys rosea f. rosea IK726]|uniref:Uncharacterized protein n=1 Tax=Clonostachys rosea f. rosea IK726 TaxID=1349383 RepID=A0ACA9UJ09_BIOOC|nr:unnamed protein product [Clonostachys rosea f. rosea IK726]
MSPRYDTDGQVRRELVRQALESHAPTIERLLEIGNSPGVSISVKCNGENIWEKGFGYADLRSAVRATGATVYPIASVTKTMAAAACAMLVAEDLQLPRHKEIEACATIVDILSHRTGLQEYSTLFEGPDGLPLFVDDKSLHLALDAMPADSGSFRGTWSYCPPLYALVTLVIEKVSAMKLSEYLNVHIFLPLGMSSTSVVGSGNDVESYHRAKPYARMQDGTWVERRSSSSGYGFPFDSSMGVQSTVADMMKWASFIIASYRAFSSSAENNPLSGGLKLLPETQTVFRTWCPLISNEGGNPAYCLGWFLHEGHYIFDDMFDSDGQTGSLEWPCTLPKDDLGQDFRTILYHSGIGHGFTSSFHVYPDQGDAVAVLGNSSHSGDAVDCISRVITSIISGLHLSIPELESNLKFYRNLEVGRWRKLNQDLAHQQSQRHRKHTLVASQVVGTFANDQLGWKVCIQSASQDRSEYESFMHSRGLISAEILFGNETDVTLPLWNFCDDTLCFLPNEYDYQRWGMCYMADWTQFLIHANLQDDASAIAGFWWQYDGSQDGIWFRRIA